MSFEEMLKELESIVSRLESGNVSLEESLKLFERGVELYKECKRILREHQMKIVDVMKELEGEEEDAAGQAEGYEL